jgi:hypothetical protein
MDKFDVGCLIGVVLILIVAAIAVIHGIVMNDKKDMACRKLGFDKYNVYQEQGVCEDKDGNIYFIKAECHGTIYIDCQAHRITIGDVSVLGK